MQDFKIGDKVLFTKEACGIFSGAYENETYTINDVKYSYHDSGYMAYMIWNKDNEHVGNISGKWLTIDFLDVI